VLFIDFLVVAFSGAVLKFVYTAGQKSGSSGVVFLFGRFDWLKIHDLTALILVSLILVHLILNLSWIKHMFKGSS